MKSKGEYDKLFGHTYLTTLKPLFISVVEIREMHNPCKLFRQYTYLNVLTNTLDQIAEQD